MESNKKTMLTIIGVAILVIGLVGVTYAFFNYTRTGTRNIIKTGRIYFNSEQDTSINLTNMFPIDVTNGIPNDNTKVGTITINVVGDTTYDEGIEYLVSAVNVSNSVGNKSVPISIDVSVTNNSGNNPATTLGTSDDRYYTNRGGNSSIYKVLSKDTISNNDQLLVGYITKGATGIDGNIVIKAYLDKAKVAITDTYDGNETDNMGTTNNWVGDRVTFTTGEWNSLQANGVSFQVKVEANEGIWVEEPIPANAFIRKLQENVMTPTSPINFANISSSSNGEGLYILPGTENDTNPIYYYRGDIDNNNVIFGDYCWQMVRTTDTGGVKMIYNGAVTGNGATCENTAHADRIISSSSYNSNQSIVGYMGNTSYMFSGGLIANAVIASGATWVNDHYELSGTKVTTPDATHHYSCDSTDANATCVSLRYVYAKASSLWYIILTDGDLMEDALYKLTGNGSNETKQKNSSYVLNQNDSTIKSTIESWFRTNLTNEVDNTKRNYVSYLEDTVYCSDRSFKTVTGNTSYPTFSGSGWNPNGNSWNPNGARATQYLYFGSWDRYQNNWYSTTNVPSTACPNETDRFSVSSSVAHLNYPVGLITLDEIVMAGMGGSTNDQNVSYYLFTGGNWWTISPALFDESASSGFFVAPGISTAGVPAYFGVRPIISLKAKTEFEIGGDGTPTNPYVVKYE